MLPKKFPNSNSQTPKFQNVSIPKPPNFHIQIFSIRTFLAINNNNNNNNNNILNSIDRSLSSVVLSLE